MRARSIWTCFACISLCVGSSVLARDTLATPIPLEVILAGDGPTQRVAGKLVAFDDAGITMHVGEAERTLAWEELAPASAFNTKFRLVDKSDAQQFLELGRWGWTHGLSQQARSALGSARKLDKSLGSQIDAILASESGSALASKAQPATKPVETPPTPPKPEAAAPASEETAPMQPGYRAGDAIVQYTIPTREENEAQITLSRNRAAEAERALDTKFTEIQTDHFLIFTDWDKAEHAFLKEKCESAYSVLAKQFQQPVKGNVFVGKLPIFMFATQKGFLRFAREFDEFGAGETVLGYFINSSTEQGHMAMWKPAVGTGIGAGGSTQDAARRWARTLVHEFAHAFISRYKSNARIPRWLNEGTAELIAEAALPTNNYHGRARAAAQEAVDVMPLFDDSNMPSGYYYPVMMTMAECLQKQDTKKFLALFDEIKAGTKPEDALKKVYGITQLKLAEGWSKYAKALR